MDPYFKLPGCNNSSLNDFLECPQLYKWKQDNPKEEKQDYFDLGTMYHKVILEPETIQRDIMFFDMEKRPEPGMTMGAKANKVWKFELEVAATNKGKQLINVEHYNQAKAMAEATLEHKAARELIQNDANEYEKVTEWEHDGMKCKSKVDITNPFFLVDLKSAAPGQAEPKAWQRKGFSTYRYHRQAGMYSDGAADGAFEVQGQTEFFFIVCSTEPPYLVAIHQVSSELLLEGILEYRRIVSEIKQCQENNFWPGYEYRTVDGVFQWEVPAWAS